MRHSSLPRRRADGFTLIELLVTMTIIAILAALTLNIAGGVQEQAARKRTLTEMQAIQTAIESYKIDNGTPPASATANAADLPTAKGTIISNPSDAKYKTASQLLFFSLTGRAGFKTVPPANTVNYLPIRRGSVGNPDSLAAAPGADASFLADAFGNPWGYYYNPDVASLPDAQDPNTNNHGFYDLWSTAKRTGSADADLQAWITNWKSN